MIRICQGGGDCVFQGLGKSQGSHGEPNSLGKDAGRVRSSLKGLREGQGPAQQSPLLRSPVPPELAAAAP